MLVDKSAQSSPFGPGLSEDKYIYPRIEDSFAQKLENEVVYEFIMCFCII